MLTRYYKDILINQFNLLILTSSKCYKITIIMCYTVITLIKAIIYILKHSFMNDLIGNISLLIHPAKKGKPFNLSAKPFHLKINWEDLIFLAQGSTHKQMKYCPSGLIGSLICGSWSQTPDWSTTKPRQLGPLWLVGH